MTSDTIWQRARRKPFAPFRIHVSDGEHYDVRHPETILIGKQSITIGIFDPGEKPGEEPPARFVIISPLHVTSIEDIPARRRASA